MSILKRISPALAAKILITLMILTLLYHLIIVLGLIPYDAVWGGRLESEEQMYSFEFVSIVINLLMLFIVLLKGSYIKIKYPKLIVSVFLWIMAILFAINTVGNIFSNSLTEAVIFTPITIVNSVLCLKLALDKEHK